jgi:hypothetical protein
MRGGKLWNHGERVLVSLSGQAGQIWVHYLLMVEGLFKVPGRFSGEEGLVQAWNAGK